MSKLAVTNTSRPQFRPSAQVRPFPRYNPPPRPEVKVTAPGFRIFRAFCLVMFLCAMWIVLQHVERHENPAGFELGMQYKIQETEQLVKQNLEARTESEQK